MAGKISDDSNATSLSGLYYAAVKDGQNVKVPQSLMGETPVTVGDDGVAISLESRFADIISVRDKGAPLGGGQDDSALFQAAVDASQTVRIPAGTYQIDQAITGAGRWIIDKGVTINGQATVGNNSLPDLSRLGGRITFTWDNATRGGMWLGDPDPWVEELRNPSHSLAELAVVSPTGQIGVFGATRTSDDLPANFAAIGVVGIANNDNDTNPEPAWGAYFEVRREEDTGAALGIEIDVANVASTYDSLSPFTVRTSTSADVIGLWLSSGGGIGSPGNGDASAAIGVNPNGRKFERGIVFMNGSLDTGSVNEMLSAPLGARLAWYDSSDLQSWMNGVSAVFTSKSDTAGNGVQDDIFRKRADGTTATGNLDEVYRQNFWGYSGSNNYAAGHIQVLQRSNFSGGNARFSVDLSAKAADGTDTEVTLNGVTDKAFTPVPDDTLTLGSGAARWTTVYATTGTINTSDARSKDIRGPLDEAERRVAKKLPGLIKTYRLKDSVEKKGKSARIHVGLIAQEVEAAFAQEGLNGWDYGILCEDAVEDGVTRMGLRYEELLCFVIGGMSV